MMTAVHKTTPKGRLKNLTLILMCKWILAAWDLLPNDQCVKSFKKCCVFNSLDGTKDSARWNGKNNAIHSEKEETANIDEDKRKVRHPSSHSLTISIRYFQLLYGAAAV